MKHLTIDKAMKDMLAGYQSRMPAVSGKGQKRRTKNYGNI